MGIKPTILPLLVLGGGATGLVSGFILQWFTNATSFDFWALVPIRGYDFLISGKPLLSTPAWIPVMFELTILLSAVGCVDLAVDSVRLAAVVSPHLAIVSVRSGHR